MSDDTSEVEELQEIMVKLGAGDGITECHQCQRKIVIRFPLYYSVLRARFEYRTNSQSARSRIIAVLCGDECFEVRKKFVDSLSAHEIARSFGYSWSPLQTLRLLPDRVQAGAALLQVKRIEDMIREYHERRVSQMSPRRRNGRCLPTKK